MRLTAEGLGHAFPGGPHLFRHVTFELLPARVTAVTGPSGSGKSTLLSILGGWLEPTHGRVVREDIRVLRWVFQNPHGVPARTALDHVVLPMLAQGRRRESAEKSALDLLDRFNLTRVAGRRFSQLSGGEAQRLMLARAIASRPDLLLIDEPTAQLDPISAGSVADVLHALAHAGTIVVIATHDPAVRASCHDHIELGKV